MIDSYRIATTRGQMGFSASSRYFPPEGWVGAGGQTFSYNQTGSTSTNSYSFSRVTQIGTRIVTNSGSGSLSSTSVATLQQYTSSFIETTIAGEFTTSLTTLNTTVFTTITKETTPFSPEVFTSTITTTQRTSKTKRFKEITTTRKTETLAGYTVTANVYDTIYEIDTKINPNVVMLVLTSMLYGSDFKTSLLQINDYVTTATKFTRSEDVSSQNVITFSNIIPSYNISYDEITSSVEYTYADFTYTSGYSFGSTLPNSSVDDDLQFISQISGVEQLTFTIRNSVTGLPNLATKIVTIYNNDVLSTGTGVFSMPASTVKTLSSTTTSYTKYTNNPTFLLQTGEAFGGGGWDEVGGNGNTTFIATEQYLQINFSTNDSTKYAAYGCSVESPHGAYLDGNFGDFFNYNGPKITNGNFFIYVNRKDVANYLFAEFQPLINSGIFSLNTSYNDSYTQSGKFITYRTGDTTEAATISLIGSPKEKIIIGEKSVFGGKPEKSVTFHQAISRGGYLNQDNEFITTDGGYSSIPWPQSSSTYALTFVPYLKIIGDGERFSQREIITIENNFILRQNRFISSYNIIGIRT